MKWQWREEACRAGGGPECEAKVFRLDFQRRQFEAFLGCKDIGVQVDVGCEETLALMEVGVGCFEECFGIESRGGFHREAAKGGVNRGKVIWREAFCSDPVLLVFAWRRIGIFPFTSEQFGFFLGEEDS
jgi:hypothetical protein